MKPSETTTIRISYKLKAELDKLVQIKSDTYETILWRLLKGGKKQSWKASADSAEKPKSLPIGTELGKSALTVIYS